MYDTLVKSENKRGFEQMHSAENKIDSELYYLAAMLRLVTRNIAVANRSCTQSNSSTETTFKGHLRSS